MAVYEDLAIGGYAFAVRACDRDKGARDDTPARATVAVVELICTQPLTLVRDAHHVAGAPPEACVWSGVVTATAITDGV